MNQVPVGGNAAISTSGGQALAVRLPRQGRFDLHFFTIAGKRILTLSKEGNQGENLIDPGRSSIPAGVYFIDLLQENSHRRAMVKVLK
jgi:hypothetical protein